MTVQGNASVTSGHLIRRTRLIAPMTLQELASRSDVSPSLLGRVERGERFPSGRTIQKISKHLGFQEEELLTLAGYLTENKNETDDDKPVRVRHSLDPLASSMLAKEPIETQRAVIGILSILKSLAKHSV